MPGGGHSKIQFSYIRVGRTVAYNGFIVARCGGCVLNHYLSLLGYAVYEKAMVSRKLNPFVTGFIPFSSLLQDRGIPVHPNITELRYPVSVQYQQPHTSSNLPWSICVRVLVVVGFG